MTVLFFKEKMEYCCFLFLKFIVILHFIVSWWITSSPNLKRRFGKFFITCSFCTYISRLTMGIFHLKVSVNYNISSQNQQFCSGKDNTEISFHQWKYSLLMKLLYYKYFHKIHFLWFCSMYQRIKNTTGTQKYNP